ncbi:putative efflux pump membrane fusion protein [Pirellulimonas nuda]|uniref:Putative efflux pump membrane fusion protein n=1 Tax=Pirellulimonas nuda TaxID=2528009 RepID=A0A518D6G5_9BACT|nr:HlyD family efflux transporter periplasmic adaptor subunit [Pirellulimonas nuda]QDU87045.1 putative efflux pump membrane fusion protein [Pirellulimonas nuda]
MDPRSETAAPPAEAGRPPLAKGNAPPNHQPQAGLPLEAVDRSLPAGANGRRKSGWRGPAVAVAAIALVGGSAWALRDPLAELLGIAEPPPPVAEPAPARVVALARLQPEGEVVSVAAPSGAGESRIEELRVQENDVVAKEDVLAVLDSEPTLRAARLVAERQAKQTAARLEQTRVVVEATQAELEAALRTAKSQTKTKQMVLEREKQLITTNATSQEQLDQVQFDYDSAVDSVREAESRLWRYRTGASEEAIDVTVARLDLEVAEAQLERARAEWRQAFIRSPIDGVVLDIHLHPGERTGQSPLLEMGATQAMMARAEVYESDVARVRVGQEVEITAAPLAEPLTGRVASIEAMVQGQTIVDADPAAHTDARVVEVWVRLDEGSSERAARLVNLQVRAEFLP